MKKGIHPTYYPKAKVQCACGNTFEVGASRESIDIEICSHCHPFYTGDDKGKMRGGQVEKFRERLLKKTTKAKKGK